MYCDRLPRYFSSMMLMIQFETARNGFSNFVSQPRSWFQIPSTGTTTYVPRVKRISASVSLPIALLSQDDEQTAIVPMHALVSD
jgi:hypothetical protein